MSRLVLQAVIKSYHAFGPCQERSRQRFLTTDLRSECDEPKRYINLLECLSCHLQRGSGWWLRRPAETWWERSGPNSSVSDNTRAFLSSTLIGISPHPAARLSSAYWQAARRNSDLVRTSVCWTRISARSMSSRISAVIFSVRVWSNFWCCISLPPLQQECNNPADVQNAAVGVGEFREVVEFLDDAGHLPTELAALFIRYARIVLGKEDTGIALCEIPEVPKLGIIPITSYVHSVVYSVGSIYFHVFSSVHICICIGIYTRVNNGARQNRTPLRTAISDVGLREDARSLYLATKKESRGVFGESCDVE